MFFYKKYISFLKESFDEVFKKSKWPNYISLIRILFNVNLIVIIFSLIVVIMDAFFKSIVQYCYKI